MSISGTRPHWPLAKPDGSSARPQLTRPGTMVTWGGRSSRGSLARLAIRPRVRRTPVAGSWASAVNSVRLRRLQRSTCSAGSAKAGPHIAPAIAEVVCRGRSVLITLVRTPASARHTAVVRPITPAPMTSTSSLTLVTVGHRTRITESERDGAATIRGHVPAKRTPAVPHPDLDHERRPGLPGHARVRRGLRPDRAQPRDRRELHGRHQVAGRRRGDPVHQDALRLPQRGDRPALPDGDGLRRERRAGHALRLQRDRADDERGRGLRHSRLHRAERSAGAAARGAGPPAVRPTATAGRTPAAAAALTKTAATW